MKTYVLTVSRTFPTYHKRKGENTGFIEKIKRGQCSMYDNGCCHSDCNLFGDDVKIHTIRLNYDFWSKRIREVQDGKAVLSLRYWSGKPYNSEQVEFLQLDKSSGVGCEKLSFNGKNILDHLVGWDKETDIINISNNDGLSLEDFKEWFKNYDLSQPMAIIHFTNFRY